MVQAVVVQMTANASLARLSSPKAAAARLAFEADIVSVWVIFFVSVFDLELGQRRGAVETPVQVSDPVRQNRVR
jgi:hypothetical protein